MDFTSAASNGSFGASLGVLISEAWLTQIPIVVSEGDLFELGCYGLSYHPDLVLDYPALQILGAFTLFVLCGAGHLGSPDVQCPLALSLL